MKIAILAPDNRENCGEYGLLNPYFGTAVTGLLEGFSMLSGDEVGAEIHLISCTRKRMPSPEWLAPNIRFHELYVGKYGMLKTGYLGCAMAVRRKLREINPDIVHAQGTERDCAVSAILSGYPCLLTIHGNLRLIHKTIGFPTFSAIRLQTFLEGIVVPRFNGVICITNYTRSAVEHEVPKTWVVPNAVDPSFLALGQQRLEEPVGTAHPDAGTPVILVVGSVDSRKNQNAFIESLDSLAKRMTFKVRFLGVCGGSDYAMEFRELVTHRPWCEYGGLIGREALCGEFAKASLLVLPTHEDNCPMVVLEAMAAGVPVIASKVGGVPDLIDGYGTGLFCDPDRPETFAHCVEYFLTHESFANQTARDAHTEAVRRFHPMVIARRHIEVYEEILSMHPPVSNHNE
jgi:glycosyltransferase involved in cell wall biosynthesis